MLRGWARAVLGALLAALTLVGGAGARPTLVPLSSYTSFDPTLTGVVGSSALSPDGRQLAYVHGWNPTGQNPRGRAQLFVHHLDDDTVTQITAGDTLGAPRFPAWSPDGQFLYFSAESGAPARRELYRAGPNGTGFLRLTFQNAGTEYDPVLRSAPVAGGGVFFATAADLKLEGLRLRNGARSIYFRAANGALERLSDPDDDLFEEAEVYAAEASGARVIYAPADPDLPRSRPLRPFRLDRAGSVTALTPLEGSSLLDVWLTPRGHVLYLGSTADYLNGGSGGRPEIYRREMTGGTLSQLTFSSFGGARHPAADSAATRLVFESNASLLPGDVTGETRVYLGTGSAGSLRRIGTGTEPTISGDGRWLAWRDVADSLGDNDDRSPEIFAARTDGSERRQITRFVRGSSQQPDVSRDGAWVVFASTADLAGGNADGSREIFRCRSDGTELKQLTSTPRGSSCDQPSLSATATHVAFVADADLIPGDNDDGNSEIFMIRMDGDSLLQVTETRSGASSSPRISADADVIAFVTTSAVVPASTVGSGRVAVWTKSTDRFRWVTPISDRTIDMLRMDDEGKRLALLTSANLADLNLQNARAVYTVSTSGLSLVRRPLPVPPRTGGLGLSASGGWIAVTDTDGALALHPYEEGAALPVTVPVGISPVYPVPSDDGTLVACALPAPAGDWKAGDYLLLNRNTGQATALIGFTQARPPEAPAMAANADIVAFTISSADTLNPDASVEVMAAVFNPVAVEGVSLQLERATGGAILLRWSVLSGTRPPAFIVERGPTASGPWREQGRVTEPTTGGAFRWLDPAPGVDAPWYRLTAIERDGELRRFGPWSALETLETPRPRLEAAPNPFIEELQLVVEPDRAGHARVELFDVRGRRIRVLHDAALPAGPTRLVWDGRDDRGDKVAAGVYYCCLNRRSTLTIVRSR